MTSKISLQTTIDIAAIVNQQQQEANDPGSTANRHDIGEALRASYAAQGRDDISPEMIERAVDTYFADRLQYKGFEGNAISRLAGGVYVRAFAHRKLLTGALAAAIVIGSSFSYIKDGVRTAGYNSIAGEFSAISKDMTELNEQGPKTIAAFEEWLVTAKATADTATASRPAYNAFLDGYETSLKSARNVFMDINSQVGRDLPHPTSAEVSKKPDEFRDQSRKLKDILSVRTKVLDTYFAAMVDIQKRSLILLKADKAYQAAVADPSIKQALTDFDVAARKASAEKHLAAGETTAAISDLSAINNLIEAKAKHQEIVAKADALIASYAGAFNYRESKDLSEALFAQASYAAGKDDLAGLNEAAKLLKALKVQEAQAAMPLTIRVVNRAGVLSGTARRWDDTGKKRYYLILEAVNKAGMAQERLVFNQETNKTEAVAVWGQEVEEATLRKVAADKKDDGIINDDVFGHKPAGVYSPIFERAVLKGTISRWPDKA